MAEDIKVASIYASTEFRIDKKSWKELDEFEKRINGFREGKQYKSKASIKRQILKEEKERLKIRENALSASRKLNYRMTRMGIEKGSEQWKTSREDMARLISEYRRHGDVRKFRDQVNALNSSLSTQGKRVDNLNDKYRRFRRSLINLTGAYSIFQGVGGVAETGKQGQRVDTLFDTMFGEGAKGEMEFLRKETDRLGMNLLDSAKQYSKFSFAAQKAGMSMGEMREIYTSMSEAAVVFGTTQADQEGIFKALTQMLSKGTVSMEELKQQLGDRINLLSLWLVTIICKFA